MLYDTILSDLDGTLRLRPAVEADGAAVAAIYAPYVTDTVITFDYEPVSGEEFSRRIRTTLERYPYLVAEENGEIIGYAYASAFKGRAAYDWSIETSIYIRMDRRGQGAGRALYEALETALRSQNVLNVNACITYPNPASVAFHEKLGYTTVAHFHRCGFKLGEWRDVIWMEKMLGEHQNPPLDFIPFSKLDREVKEHEV